MVNRYRRVFKTIALLPAMQVADLAHNRQPETRAAGIGGSAKTPEKHFLLQWHGAGIGDLQQASFRVMITVSSRLLCRTAFMISW